ARLDRIPAAGGRTAYPHFARNDAAQSNRHGVLGYRVDAGLSRRCAQACARSPTSGACGSASAVVVPQSGAFDGCTGGGGIAIQCPESILGLRKGRSLITQSAVSALGLAP